MGMFVKMANTLGIANISARRSKLQIAAGNWVHKELMFYIAGYDYITAPSDEKFEGLKAAFFTQHQAMNDALNWRKIPGDQQAVDAILQGYSNGSPANISVMCRALEYASCNIQINSSLQSCVNSGKPAEGGKFNTMCTEMSEYLAPYWGSDTVRLGLDAKGKPPKSQAKIGKMSRWTYWNIQTRGRSERIGRKTGW